MNLKKHIKDNYGTVYRFCLEKNVSQARVSYWLSKDWERLTYTTKQKIKKLLFIAIIFTTVSADFPCNHETRCLDLRTHIKKKKKIGTELKFKN